MNRFLFTTILLLALSSCELNKVITSAPNHYIRDTKEIINLVKSKSHHPKWLVLQGRANITQNNQKVFVNINIINRKDSLVWISARAPFGIEMFRAQITQDSIFFINRLAKNFYKKTIKESIVFMSHDFTFCNIQELITANPRFSIDQYILKFNNETFYLYSDSSSFSINKNYKIHSAKYFKNGESLEVILENYVLSDNFPRKHTVTIKGKETLEASVTYTKVDFKKPKKILFEIPKSYDEIY